MSEVSSQQRIGRRTLQSRWVALTLILLIGVLLGLCYSPLLYWIGKRSVSAAQLHSGALLVLFAVAICLRDTIQALRVEPNLNNDGLGLLFLGIACSWLAGHLPFAQLPLALFSFCLSFAAIISFLFGHIGVRTFLPALGGFFVFGLLVGMFPAVDWPLREIAGKYSASILNWMHVPVKLMPVPRHPPELLLSVKDKLFIVATECNGFGLL